MIKIIKITIIGLLAALFLAIVAIYVGLHLSLPKLSGELKSRKIVAPVTIERDRLGTAVVSGKNRQDVAFALGFAHGQDRFFQMDLLRRNSAGELSEIFGPGAVSLDKRHRFHQLRKRAEQIFDKLPTAQQQLLERYSDGVNQAITEQSLKSFEYILTGASPKPWQPTDSLLVIYSMYLDLQGNTINRDMALTMVERLFGQPMRQFITQTSNYQAALDNSLFPSDPPLIPRIEQSMIANRVDVEIAELEEVGSNNWAVTGAHTESGSAMLSDDMHLSFAVPIIWYRAQLNYPAADGQKVQVTGVSLPGAPAIVVGSNGKVAWGFTNAYIDTADWIAIDDSEALTLEHETIKLPDSVVDFQLPMSRFGPVKTYGDRQYALAWVAHQDYAVDMELMELETASSAEEGLELAKTFGVPVQNLLIVDDKGNAGWQPTGAIPSRTNPADIAQPINEIQAVAWEQDEGRLPREYNPKNGLLWSANARVMSTRDAIRFGDGGYALGARSAQIRDRLQQQQEFNEADFYRIQLDNQARFYRPWQDYLVNALMSQPQRFAKDIQYLRQWQECACSDSVGFTLVKSFRNRLIDAAFSPVENALRQHDLSLSVLKRYLEPAIWQLLNEQAQSWLPSEYTSWDEFVIASYVASTESLLAKYSDSNNYQDLAWGRVNSLQIQHPFSKQIPLLSNWLDMPTVEGFGDTFMPAVQGKNFGASQRFIVQPGLEAQGILTIPGGQSGHPLSKYYRSGFKEYTSKLSTPLLPGEVEARLTLQPTH
ncbi:penicillin acylase family protein [Shewanella mesophila]|uniref:penicillin acylase family protein n=1 Tax=Shewanella mesophila TaxID=2864208 RepID=UPI001C65DDA5|nr:penicillin acylase family protein [Shewanella mesophila]QYJ87252.1 penicillin acylase family protein [Shewanella mesophila]